MVYGPIYKVYTSIYFFIQGVGIPDASVVRCLTRNRWQANRLGGPGKRAIETENQSTYSISVGMYTVCTPLK